MKRIIFFGIILGITFLNWFRLYAAPKISGIGLTIGSLTGINLKHFLLEKDIAVEFDFSVVSGKFYITGNYLLHNFSVFPRIEEGELPLFYGISIGILGNDLAFGGVVGVSYLFKDHPFDVFIKISPVVFEKKATFTFMGGIGGRYFFK